MRDAVKLFTVIYSQKDLNPQTFFPNIFEPKAEDFKKQTHKVYNDSSIEFTILKN